MDSIRISISSDAKELQPTIDKLKEVGVVSETNAAKFKVAEEQYQATTKTHEQLLEREIQNLAALKRARDKATNVENVVAYNKSIKEQEGIIKNLSPQTEKAVSSMDNFGSSVKKSYGYLRILANILPGVGISGLVVAGFELLSFVVGDLIGETKNLNAEEEKYNTQHLEDVNEIISKERELNYEIEKRNILLGIQKRTNTDADLERLTLNLETEKEIQKISLEYLKKKNDLDADRKKFGFDDQEEEIKNFTQGKQEIIKIDRDANKSLTDDQEQYYNAEKNLEIEKQRALLAQRSIFLNKYAEITEKENAKHAKLVEDISVQELENQKKRVDANAKILAIQSREEIGSEIENKVDLDNRLAQIEADKNLQTLNLDKQIAKKKRDQELVVADKTITDQVALNNRIYNINLAYKDKLSALDNTYQESKLVDDVDLYDKLLKDYDEYSKEQAKEVQDDLKKRLSNVKENEERLADVLKLNNETNYTNGKIKQAQHDKKDIEDQLAVLELKKTNLEEFSNEYIEIEIKEQELKKQLRDQEKKDLKKNIDEMISELKELQDFFIGNYQKRIQANIDYIDHQETLTQNSIEQQQELAIVGKANTLAFEKKSLADEEKLRLQNEKKLKRSKELEVFLNAMASFSKDDPKSALGKALALLAVTIGTEATFAEEGGLLGQINTKSWAGRKHKGGGDILVHAQTGEGILSRNDISAMGGEKAFLNFKNMLGNGLPPIPMTGVMFQGVDIKPLQDEVKELRKDIANKKEIYVDFESMKNMLVMNVTTTEKGIKETVKHELKRRTIRG